MTLLTTVEHGNSIENKAKCQRRVAITAHTSKAIQDCTPLEEGFINRGECLSGDVRVLMERPGRNVAVATNDMFLPVAIGNMWSVDDLCLAGYYMKRNMAAAKSWNPLADKNDEVDEGQQYLDGGKPTMTLPEADVVESDPQLQAATGVPGGSAAALPPYVQVPSGKTTNSFGIYSMAEYPFMEKTGVSFVYQCLGGNTVEVVATQDYDKEENRMLPLSKRQSYDLIPTLSMQEVRGEGTMGERPNFVPGMIGYLMELLPPDKEEAFWLLGISPKEARDNFYKPILGAYNDLGKPKSPWALIAKLSNEELMWPRLASLYERQGWRMKQLRPRNFFIPLSFYPPGTEDGGRCVRLGTRGEGSAVGEGGQAWRGEVGRGGREGRWGGGR